MRLAVVLLSVLPGLAFAAGSDDPVATPKPTKTTQECTGVQVWDEATQKCVDPKNGALSPDVLKDAVRELAYAGRFEDAQGVLRAIPDQQDDYVLTYWGFTHRKLGDAALAMEFYKQALDRNPDNLLARSYMGQAHVEAGRMMAARTQLREIRARGGAGLWPEISLAQAIETGATYNY
ncbi:MAG: tetratricopeptide repeat protein [Rhodobacteraceae bacterium]|nr:MAG: tetratricopeptide repeat protein [Paracoccaceae bacterium]